MAAAGQIQTPSRVIQPNGGPYGFDRQVDTTEQDNAEKIHDSLMLIGWVSRFASLHGEGYVWAVAEHHAGQPFLEALERAKKDISNLSSALDALSLDNVTEVEDLHEDILSNMVQGTTHKELARRLVKKPHLSLLEDMKDYLSDKTTLFSHLEAIREQIETGLALVRRLHAGEAEAFMNRARAGSAEEIFLKGKESMKAFAVGKRYQFKDKKRNAKEDDYQYVLEIPLTRELKDYLLKYIYANLNSILEINFSKNPQFKYEQGGITVLIPKTAWANFWSRVSHFSLTDSSTGMPVTDPKAYNDKLWYQWHQQQLAGFNMLGDSGGRPSYIS